MTKGYYNNIVLKNIRYALEKTNNIRRAMYFWNSINATLSAFQAPVILIVMTRTNGVDDAGVFSIAFAVGSLMLFVGQYGLRRFQASDVKEQYTFADYCGLRIITCAAMIIASVVYCGYGVFFNDYTAEKFTVVLLICMLRVIQAVADVMHGRIQQKERLDVAAKASAARFMLETAAYITALIVTHDLVIATVVCISVSFIVFMLTSVNVMRNYGSMKPQFASYGIKGLLIAGLPLFLSTFLNMYIGNAPKYAIDSFLSDQIQAYYNFIFMPAFAIQLLSNFIYNPMLTSYAEVWAKNEFKKFNKLIRQQMVIVVIITVVGLAIAATIGIPLLSIIFGVDLSDYKTELCIVMVGGGMMAYATFFSIVITIIRAQITLIWGYGIIAILAKVFSEFFVVNYGILGTTLMYAVLMILLALVFFVIMIYKIKKLKALKSV